jgi:hypothetical protein
MNMSKKMIFGIAHARAKRVHIKGDSYQVTFGSALRNLYKELKRQAFSHPKLRTWQSKDAVHCRAYPDCDYTFAVAMQKHGIACKSAWVNVDSGAIEFDGLRKYGKNGFDGSDAEMQTLAISFFKQWLAD